MSSSEATTEVREQDSVLACLERMRQLHSDLSLIDVCVLLLVAERPGVTLADIEFHLGISKITASRALRAFATPDFRNALPPALGLVDLRRNSRDSRTLRAQLTDRGESFVQTLNDLISKGAQI